MYVCIHLYVYINYIYMTCLHELNTYVCIYLCTSKLNLYINHIHNAHALTIAAGWTPLWHPQRHRQVATPRGTHCAARPPTLRTGMCGTAAGRISQESALNLFCIENVCVHECVISHVSHIWIRNVTVSSIPMFYSQLSSQLSFEKNPSADAAGARSGGGVRGPRKNARVLGRAWLLLCRRQIRE